MKKDFLTSIPALSRTLAWSNQGERNVGFSEDFAYVLNELPRAGKTPYFDTFRIVIYRSPNSKFDNESHKEIKISGGVWSHPLEAI